MNDVANIGPPIERKHDSDLADERRHFYRFQTCDKSVVMRDRRQVRFHERWAQSDIDGDFRDAPKADSGTAAARDAGR